MTAAAFDEDTIDDTLSQLGLKNGGRVGAMNGGIMTAKRGLVKCTRWLCRRGRNG
jgi:hypothetical protein